MVVASVEGKQREAVGHLMYVKTENFKIANKFIGTYDKPILEQELKLRGVWLHPIERIRSEETGAA